MSIFVNVSRSTTPTSSEEELLEATIGDWPFRGSDQTIHDIEPYADVIYGVRRNEIVSAYAVKAVQLTADHSRFVIKPDPDIDLSDGGLVGTPLPDEIAWRRGQQWPVKLVITTEFDQYIDARRQAVSLGGYQIELTDGALRVQAPRGGTVVVETSR